MQRQEVLQQARADPGRTLGVKLHSEKIAPFNTGAEGCAIAAGRDGRCTRRNGVAVHEVGIILVSKTLEQGAAALNFECVPAHMGNRMARRLDESPSYTRNDAETLRLAFLGCLEQQL